MPDAIDVLDEAIAGVGKLRKTLSKGSSVQVTSYNERALVKATALAWVRKQRLSFIDESKSSHLGGVDQGFRKLLEFSDRSTTRDRYKEHLKILRGQLVALRSEVIGTPAIASLTRTDAQPPDWSTLVPDPMMRVILSRRWDETSSCMDVGASLAATVMMGALLEALLLSRVNHEGDKRQLFKAKAAPKDRSGKTLPLQDWTLNGYIEVAHELGWIRQSARDIGAVLRDYRNFIHPAKELSRGISIERDDAEMFWVVFRSLAEQIARSV